MDFDQMMHDLELHGPDLSPQHPVPVEIPRHVPPNAATAGHLPGRGPGPLPPLPTNEQGDHLQHGGGRHRHHHHHHQAMNSLFGHMAG